MLRANVHARRLKPDIDTVRAIVAFRSGVIVRLHKKSIVRTGLRAGFAADTAAIIEIDDTVFAGEKCGNRADLDARGIGAVIATHHRKKPPRIGESSFFNIFDPRAVDPDGDFMLGFTRNSTGMTADTLSVIDDEAKIHVVFAAWLKLLQLQVLYYTKMLSAISNSLNDINRGENVQ